MTQSSRIRKWHFFHDDYVAMILFPEHCLWKQNAPSIGWHYCRKSLTL